MKKEKIDEPSKGMYSMKRTVMSMCFVSSTKAGTS